MSMDNIESQHQANTGDNEQEIDLVELATKLWKNRKQIIKWCCIGAVVGLVVAFSIPREYTASVTLAPEISGNKSAAGGLGALASLAGVNISSGATTDAVYPQLYPDVVSSNPFTVGLFNVELSISDSDAKAETLQTIIEDKTSSPWWSAVVSAPFKFLGWIKDLFSSQEEVESDTLNPFKLTTKQAAIAEAIRNRVSATVDTKTSVVTISAMLQDPVAAAQLADTVTQRLKNFVSEYRTSKARQDLEYARKINEEARQEYYTAQKNYASASDRNHGLSTRTAQIDLERLQNEAQLAFSIYNNAAQQVKMAEAKVQENTPVFAVVQPASVPVKPTKPSKVMILVGFTFLAFVLSSAKILFWQSFIDEFKKKSSGIKVENNSDK